MTVKYYNSLTYTLLHFRIVNKKNETEKQTLISIGHELKVELFFMEYIPEENVKLPGEESLVDQRIVNKANRMVKLRGNAL